MTDPRSPITLLGAGGHALVVAYAAREAERTVLGAFDDSIDAEGLSGHNALEPLGPISEFDQSGPWILAIGSLGARRAIIENLGSTHACTVVHPSAVVAPDAHIGAGVFVGPGAVVHPRARIGNHAIINTRAVVEHECDIGENSHVAPGAVLCGNVTIGRDTLVGAGSTIIPGISVGDSCTVGAGAVVLHDTEPGVTVVGSPARALMTQR